MNINKWTMAGACFLWVFSGLVAQEAPVEKKPPAKAPSAAAASKQAEADLQAHNAALTDNGARVSLKVLEKAVPDKSTTADQTFDGNSRSRCVVSYAPYIFRVELVDRLPVTDIHFIMSAYESEAAPRDVEVTLSDGSVLKKTLETLRPTKTDPMPRQTLKVDREVAWFEVKVLSINPGVNKEGQPVNYGGLGEIEAVTTADLRSYMEVPDLNKTMPVYVNGGAPRNDYSGVKVTMPPKIGLQGYPRIFMTRAEIVKWRDEIQKTERGKAAVKSVRDVVGSLLDAPVVMPDPKVPAQLKDRGDAAAKAHDRLSVNAGRLGWAYQLTDNEAYAAKAREILVGYARLYPNDYAEHKGVNGNDTGKVMAQRLSEAMWLLPLIQAYDLVHDAQCMTDADRTLIETDLLRAGVAFINGKRDAATEAKQRDTKGPGWRTEDPDTGGKAMGNWMNFYNAAFIQAGIVTGDQDWIDIGAANTRLMIARGISDDGMWKEGAIGYQYFARMALVACMEPLARQGINIYSSNKARVKNLFDAVYKYAYPDGTMPGINDSSRANVGGDWYAMAYDYGWLRYNDPNYGAAVNAAPRQIFQSSAVYFPTVIYDKLPEQPMQGLDSVIFDGLGYNIMRGKDGGGPTYLLLKCGAVSGGPHDHPDKLNLIVFADGDELCGEPQFYRYEDNRHPEWTKTTLGHYSLAVDERNQMKADALLTVYDDHGAVKVMRGQCTGAYPGVGLDRTVIQMPGYLVDLYRAWGRTSHTFDYPLCFRGELDALKGVDAAGLKAMGSSSQGYSLFMTKPASAISGNWSGVWSRAAREAVVEGEDVKTRANPANEIKVTVVGDGETRVFAGIGPDASHKAVLRRKGTSAVFASVIDPYKAGDAVKSVESFKVDGPVPAYGLKVVRTDGGTDLVIVRFDAQKEAKPAAASSFPGGKTDALVSVVRKDASGKVIGAGMLGGTGLTCDSTTLTLAAPGIKWEK